ncbi:MAG TPA: LysM peptidoglycan-binding domain-containing protein [Thermoflexia bacterium]|jgi:peptidoglycan endopeptidase LytF|nr:LysM peptidoglycan-binding domain-containing protein [Thermoflexia bacterium]
MKRLASLLIVALLLLLVVSPAVSAAPPQWGILGYHVVQPGETLFCIGRAYGVSPWAIATQNGVVNPNLIQPGMVLAIPSAYAYLPPGPVCTPQFDLSSGFPCACSSYYTVQSGDTLTRISLLYDVSMWRIAECNSIFNLNYIRIGDVLCIPDP